MSGDARVWRLTSEELVALGAMAPEREDGTSIDGEAGVRSLMARGLLVSDPDAGSDDEHMVTIDGELASIVEVVGAPEWVAVLSRSAEHEDVAVGRMFGRAATTVLEQEALALGVHDLQAVEASPVEVVAGALLEACPESAPGREPILLSDLDDDAAASSILLAWDDGTESGAMRALAWIIGDGGLYVIDADDRDHPRGRPVDHEHLLAELQAMFDLVPGAVAP